MSQIRELHQLLGIDASSVGQYIEFAVAWIRQTLPFVTKKRAFSTKSIESA